METTIDERPYEAEGRTFKAYRILADLTQRELGMELGIPLNMIREYEQGRCLPSALRLIAIMERLDIPVGKLSPAVATVAPSVEPKMESTC